MKKNQDGFITMIVVLALALVLIVGFAIYRITNANKTTESHLQNSSVSVVE